MKKNKGAKRGGVHIPALKSASNPLPSSQSTAPEKAPAAPSAIRLPGSRPASGKVRAWYFTGYLYGMLGLEFLTFLAIQATPAAGIELLRYAALLLTFLDIFALIHLFLWKKWAVWVHFGVLLTSAIGSLLQGQIQNAVWLVLHIAIFAGVLNIGKRTVRQWPKFE